MEVAARKGRLHFLASTPTPELIVLLKDGDQDPDGRRRGLAQARDEHARSQQPLAVAIGVPRPEIEAGIVAGFDPQDSSESDALAAVRERIHFDPTRTHERLTSKYPSDPKDAKRVRSELGIDAVREATCLDDLERLRSRGAGCGLVELLDDLRGALLPILDPSTR